MPVYTHRFQVKASLAQVAQFHQDARALKQLTPPPVFVQFHEIEPLAEGSRADFTMWLGPIPVHWLAVHSDVDPQQGFTDTQVTGPFLRWVHRHNFHVIDENCTEIEDTIEAQPGNHPFWGLVSRFMWSNLPMLFSHRQKATRKALEAPRP